MRALRDGLPPAAAFLALASLFLLANRGAYRSYFANDDLDTISWARHISPKDVAAGLLRPLPYANNFRPTGHGLYAALARTAGLDFRPYVAAIHVIHLAAVLAVWHLLRALAFSAASSAAGVLTFAFAAATYEIYWKPMFLFDLLCGLFCALALLAWIRGPSIVALVCFWLAFKSKEIAIMLPAALAAYEGLIGQRQWKRLAPFFAIAATAALQALLTNSARDDSYRFHFTASALWSTLQFYSSRVFLIPYLGFGLVAAAAMARDRKTWLGLVVFAALLSPLLVLPGRMFGAYLYVPLIGLSIMAASLVRARVPAFAFAAAWLSWNYIQLLNERKAAIAEGNLNRTIASTIVNFSNFSPNHSQPKAFVYIGDVKNEHHWGVQGLCRYLNPGAKFLGEGDRDMLAALNDPPVEVLEWVEPWRKLLILFRDVNTPDQCYLKIDQYTPLWQLGSGWRGLEWSYRWIEPHATARLMRPAGARRFELKALIGPDLIAALGRTTVTVSIDGRPIGSRAFTNHGWQMATFDAGAGTSGPVQVAFDVEPPFDPRHDGRHALGVAIGGFGFQPSEGLHEVHSQR
jgi:hypothetical protein